MSVGPGTGFRPQTTSNKASQVGKLPQIVGKPMPFHQTPLLINKSNLIHAHNKQINFTNTPSIYIQHNASIIMQEATIRNSRFTTNIKTNTRINPQRNLGPNIQDYQKLSTGHQNVIDYKTIYNSQLKFTNPSRTLTQKVSNRPSSVQHQRIQIQAPSSNGSNARLRTQNFVNSSAKKEIKFPVNVTVSTHDRIYGIDSTRGALITSIEAQKFERKLVISGQKIRNGHHASPLAINPLNDAWKMGVKKLTLDSTQKDGMGLAIDRYSEHLGKIPEVSDRQEASSATSIIVANKSLDETQRRRVFGVLSKAGIKFAYENGYKVFYGLDIMDIEGAFDVDNKYFHTVSSQELRYIFANTLLLCPNEADNLDQNTVRFIMGQKEVAAPWYSPRFKDKINANVTKHDIQRRKSFSEVKVT